MIWVMSIANRVAAKWLRAGYTGPDKCLKCRGSGFDSRTLDDCPACGGTGRVSVPVSKRNNEESDMFIVWDTSPMNPEEHKAKRKSGPLEQTAKRAYVRFMHEIAQLPPPPDDDAGYAHILYREVLVDKNDPESVIGIVGDVGERTDAYLYFPKSKGYEDTARKMAESDFNKYAQTGQRP